MVNKPVVVVDVDGVLLNWQSHLIPFCMKNGLDTKKAEMIIDTEAFLNPFGDECCEKAQRMIRKYNASDYMEILDPYSDAYHFFRNNSCKDFDFILCTAMSEKEEDINKRIKNIKNTFGDIFKTIFYCDTMSDKVELYKEIKDTFGVPVAFIDDKPSNLDDAHEVWGDGVKYIHVVRGMRDSTNIKSLVVPNLKYLKI